MLSFIFKLLGNIFYFNIFDVGNYFVNYLFVVFDIRGGRRGE